MNRRSFISLLAAVTVAGRMTFQPELEKEMKQSFSYDPIEYIGEFRWINTAHIQCEPALFVYPIAEKTQIMKHPCSLCGSRDWPNTDSQCPLCREDAPVEDETETMPIGMFRGILVGGCTGDGSGYVCHSCDCEKSPMEGNSPSGLSVCMEWSSVANLPRPIQRVLEQFGIEGDSITFEAQKISLEAEDFELAADIREQILDLEEFDCFLSNSENQILVVIQQP